MSALLDSLAAAHPPEDAARKALLDATLHDGLPGPRSEAWKYTPLRALERRSFTQPAPEQAALEQNLNVALLADIPSPRMVFVNGRLHQQGTSLDDLPAGIELRPLSEAITSNDPREYNFLERHYEGSDAVFARLNAALAGQGVVLRIAADTQVATPVHLVFIGAPADADQAWHLRNMIELRAKASLQLVEHHLASAAHNHLSNALSHVHVGHGATLTHTRLQYDSSGATSILRSDVVLAREAEYRRMDLELGAALTRHELNVRLEGQGAHLQANGVLLADGRRHVDTRLNIEHIAGDTTCELTWRGIGAGRGRAVFHGGITIRAGADGSDANLSSKNLLLSDAAEIDTQPVLEIHADEVKAAHGATVGQLDQTALFYLRSRGLPHDEARRLLTTAFCREPLAMIEDGALRAQLETQLDAALARQATT